MVLIASVAVGVLAGLAILSSGARGAANDLVMQIMTVLPTAAGLLAGVPLVSSEIEERTALVAWSLYGSRMRWLGSKGGPILILLLGAVALPAGLAAAVAEGSDAAQAFADMGAYGLPAIARAAAAFGLGVLVGAYLGRMLPALIVAGAVMTLLLLVSSEVRWRWLPLQTPLVLAGDPAEVIETGTVIITPEGLAIAVEDAIQRVPATEVSASAWLAEKGYASTAGGVPRDRALSWASYEVAAFGAVAAIGVGATRPVVARRRLA